MDTFIKYLKGNEHLFDREDGYELVPVTYSLFEEAVFAISDVMTNGLPLMNDEVSTLSYSTYIREILRIVVNVGYCYCLLHNGKLCSFIIAADLLSPPSLDVTDYILWYNSAYWTAGEYDRISSNNLVLRELLNKCWSQVLPAHKDRCFHILMGGTCKEYEGKGIGHKMRKVAVNLAKSYGYKYLLVEAFNPITTHIWKEKLNGQIIASLNLSKDLGPTLSPKYTHLGMDYSIHSIRVTLSEPSECLSP